MQILRASSFGLAPVLSYVYIQPKRERGSRDSQGFVGVHCGVVSFADALKLAMGGVVAHAYQKRPTTMAYTVSDGHAILQHNK